MPRNLPERPPSAGEIKVTVTLSAEDNARLCAEAQRQFRNRTAHANHVLAEYIAALPALDDVEAAA